MTFSKRKIKLLYDFYLNDKTVFSCLKTVRSYSDFEYLGTTEQEIEMRHTR